MRIVIQQKHSPYIFIAVICVMTALFGYWVYPHFSWYVNLMGLACRFLSMCLLWQLIGFINKKLGRRFTLEQRPATQIILQVLVTLLVLSPIFIVSAYLTEPFAKSIDQRHWFPMIIVMFIVTVMMMTFGYYTYDLFIKYRTTTVEKTKLALQTAQLEKDSSMMRYHHLKNQVNPHFLFNTLTSLDGLIHVNPALASDFVRHLSKVYRYVLEHKENEVVSLETEVNFIQHYISLLQIRYKETLDIRLHISDTGMEKGIVMVTLQMLIDNAIKHNSMQTDQPLQLYITDESDYLCIRNNKQLRKQIESSNGHGLKQLKELYAYLTDKPVLVKETEHTFEVNLPLL